MGGWERISNLNTIKMKRFTRELSVGAFEYLQKEGKFIIPEIKSARPEQYPFTLDIHLREKDKLMVYVGTTCILTLKINAKTKKVKFSAHETYRDKFLDTYKFSTPPISKIASYLKRTLPKVDKSKFRDKKEGFYQNMMCYLNGEIAHATSPFVIFDRECVIGFTDNKERKSVLEPFKIKYPGIGNELDMLAIDKYLNLICIELKYADKKASKNKKIYLTPKQVAKYRELFSEEKHPHPFFEDIKQLINQKVELGLLPKFANSLFTNKSDFKDVLSYVVVAESENISKNNWEKMKDVINENPKDISCEIFTINGNGTMLKKDITDL